MQLLPAVVDLERHTERRRRLAGAQQRGADDPVGLADPLDHRRHLGSADAVEREVEAPLEEPTGVGRRPTVAYEHEHRQRTSVS